MIKQHYAKFHKVFENEMELIEPNLQSDYFTEKTQELISLWIEYKLDVSIFECFFLLNTFFQWPNIQLKQLLGGLQKTEKHKRDFLFGLEAHFEEIYQETLDWARLGSFYQEVSIDNTGNNLFRSGKIWFENKRIIISINSVGKIFEAKWKDQFEIYISLISLKNLIIARKDQRKLIIRSKSTKQKRVLVLLTLFYSLSKGKDRIIGDNYKKQLQSVKELNFSVLAPMVTPKKKEREYLIDLDRINKYFYEKSLIDRDLINEFSNKKNGLVLRALDFKS